MQINCVHCGGAVAIAAENLERQAFCPHCGQELILPQEAVPEEDEGRWSIRTLFDNSISGLASMVIHMAVLFLLAYLQFGGSGVAGEGEDAFIGKLPGVELGEGGSDLAAMTVTTEASAASAFDNPLEQLAPTSEFAVSSPETDFAAQSAATASGSNAMTFGTGTGSGEAANGNGGSGSFEGMVQGLRRSGLDIVIVFDATGSMGGEIDQVKGQIRRIGDTLFTLIPKARISLVAFRDEGSEFVTKGQRLTDNVQEIDAFLAGIEARYGGDLPESVDKGLEWAIKNNGFRQEARKVILVFGDAPPHEVTQTDCEKMAADFHATQQGIVSTVTCRHPDTMPEFDAIAQAGAGESFLTRDEREIMSQLMVLVFGSKHKAKVLEAFKLMGR